MNAEMPTQKKGGGGGGGGLPAPFSLHGQHEDPPASDAVDVEFVELSTPSKQIPKRMSRQFFRWVLCKERRSSSASDSSSSVCVYQRWLHL